MEQQFRMNFCKENHEFSFVAGLRIVNSDLDDETDCPLRVETQVDWSHFPHKWDPAATSKSPETVIRTRSVRERASGRGFQIKTTLENSKCEAAGTPFP